MLRRLFGSEERFEQYLTEFTTETVNASLNAVIFTTMSLPSLQEKFNGSNYFSQFTNKACQYFLNKTKDLVNQVSDPRHLFELAEQTVYSLIPSVNALFIAALATPPGYEESFLMPIFYSAARGNELFEHVYCKTPLEAQNYEVQKNKFETNFNKLKLSLNDLQVCTQIQCFNIPSLMHITLRPEFENLCETYLGAEITKIINSEPELLEAYYLKIFADMDKAQLINLFKLTNFEYNKSKNRFLTFQPEKENKKEQANDNRLQKQAARIQIIEDYIPINQHSSRYR